MKKKNFILLIFIGLFLCVGIYFWKSTPNEQQPENNQKNSHPEQNIPPQSESSLQQLEEEQQETYIPEHKQIETPIEELNFSQNTYNSQQKTPYQNVNIKL